jgi:hypothetical protein
MKVIHMYDDSVQVKAPEGLGKSGYFPFLEYTGITIKHVLDAVERENGTLFDNIQMGLKYYNHKQSTLFEKITDDHDIMINVTNGSNEGIYLVAYKFVYGTKDPIKNIISCKTLSRDDHTMARAWQSAGNLYRFLNGWWEP